MAIANSLLLLLLPLLLLLAVLALAEDGSSQRGLTGSDTVAQFLNQHNTVRARLGVPPLQWSTRLASYARWYAGQRRGDCALVHSTADYGENLFWGQGRQWAIADAVGAWAAQQQYYNYRLNQCAPNRDCLHFTQLVWRATQRVGCARVTCNSGDTFIACEYDPHGNVIGERPY